MKITIIGLVSFIIFLFARSQNVLDTSGPTVKTLVDSVNILKKKSDSLRIRNEFNLRIVRKRSDTTNKKIKKWNPPASSLDFDILEKLPSQP